MDNLLERTESFGSGDCKKLVRLFLVVNFKSSLINHFEEIDSSKIKINLTKDIQMLITIK